MKKSVEKLVPSIHTKLVSSLDTKKAQVTIFIIIAVIVLVIVGVFFFVKDGFGGGSDMDVSVINNYVHSCVEMVSEDAVYNIGQTGGYYLVPEKSTSTNVAIYDKDSVPSKEDIESELSKFVKNSLFFCTRNFVDFKEYEFEQGEISVESKIKEGVVEFEIDYPIKVMRGEEVVRLERFEGVVEVRLGEIVSFLSKVSISEGELCISCISNSAFDHDLYVDMFDYTEDIIMFSVRDEKLKINEEDYRFYLAIEK